jgi:hypothetical protein
MSIGEFTEDALQRITGWFRVAYGTTENETSLPNRSGGVFTNANQGTVTHPAKSSATSTGGSGIKFDTLSIVRTANETRMATMSYWTGITY